MFTYLIILLATIALIAVYVRRYFILKRPPVVEKEGGADPLEMEDRSSVLEEKDVPKKDLQKVKELCEKADSLVARGEEEEAIKTLIQALTIDEHNVEAQHKLGILYMQKQMYGAASALFKNLAELTNEAVHFSHLGLAYYQVADFESAKYAYQKAIIIDPERPQRFVNLAMVYRSMQKPYHSLIAIKKALEIDPAQIEYLLVSADLMMEIGEMDEAKSFIGKVLEADPENVDAKELLKKWRELIKA